jgi:outer membrane protein TolC
MSLEEVMTSSLESPKAKATWHDIAAIDALNDTAKYAAYYPKVGLLAERVARDRDIYLAASPLAPLIQTPFGNTNYYMGGLELYQTLWNSELMSYKIPSAGLLLKASKKKAEWERMSIQYSTAMLFLDCKIAEIKKSSTLKRIINLETLYKESKKNLSTGKVSQSEVLKIELAISDTKNGLHLVDLGFKTCRSELGRMTNAGEDIKPGNFKIDKFENLYQNKRADLEAFRNRIDALILEKNGIISESVPEVYVRGNLIYNNQGNIEPFSYSQVGLGVKMKILDGGTQLSRTKQKEEEILSLEEEYRDTVNKVNISIEESKNRIKVAQQSFQIFVNDLESSRGILISERIKYSTGRSLAMSYLQIQEIVLEREEKKSISEIDLVRARITEKYVTGNLFINYNQKQ